MSAKKRLYRVGSINFQPNEKYLYITNDRKWLLVREKGANFITQNNYDRMVKEGMPNIFERVEK